MNDTDQIAAEAATALEEEKLLWGRHHAEATAIIKSAIEKATEPLKNECCRLHKLVVEAESHAVATPATASEEWNVTGAGDCYPERKPDSASTGKLDILVTVRDAILDFQSRYPEIAFFELTLAQIEHTLAATPSSGEWTEEWDKAVVQMRKALICLHLEVDAGICADLTKRFDAVEAAHNATLQPQRKEAK